MPTFPLDTPWPVPPLSKHELYFDALCAIADRFSRCCLLGAVPRPRTQWCHPVMSEHGGEARDVASGRDPEPYHGIRDGVMCVHVTESVMG